MEQRDELRAYFEQKLAEHKKRNPDDHKSLIGALLYLGSSGDLGSGTLGDALISQINYQAERKKVSPKQFTDYLFAQKNYDWWMSALQS